MASPVTWDLSVPDWQDKIRNYRPPLPDNLPLNDVVAEKALRIFKRLKVPDIEGTPRYGDVCGEWVFDLVRIIFGALDPETRVRAIREIFLLIPKKNGKTSIAAAIMVTAMILNTAPRAEAIIVSETKKIADIAFDQAKGIIDCDPELAKVFHPRRDERSLTHRRMQSVLRIMAADTDAITGTKATYILIDEVHEFAKNAKANQIFIEVEGGLASKPWGFAIYITTQSKETPKGVFLEKLTLAREVRDGKIKLPILPVLFELPPDLVKDWESPRTWGMVNPNIGLSVSESFLRDGITKSRRFGPSALTLFASQHFNVQIGVGLIIDGWPGAQFWLEGATRGTDRPSNVESDLDLEAIIERCEVAAVGIDGGGLDDLLGLCVLGRERGTGRWLAWFRAWAHRIVLERRKDIAGDILSLEQEGSLRIVDVPGEDVSEVADIVMRLEEAGLLAEEKAIGVDAIGIGDIIDEITTREGGVSIERFWPISQGFRLNGAIKTTERKLAGNEIIHNGSRLMTWCVGNAKVEPKGNAMMITKAVSGSAKIDPLMAGFNAVTIMSTNPVARGRSVYEDRGMLAL